MALIDITIVPRPRDLGGFNVHRVLPYAQRRMVGPFIFLDEMGPAQFAAEQGIEVRPHPHIGLSTVTYLFDGRIMHRDTLGSAQEITPGAVNWMTAGRGIAHSERTPTDERGKPHPLHGLQSWVALPKEFETTAPAFHHHPADSLAHFTQGGIHGTVIAGRAYGEESRVAIHSPLFYVELHMPAGSRIALPDNYHERALYLLSGKLRAGGTPVAERTMPVFGHGENVMLEAETDCHLVLKGGDPFPEPRFIWWNFVASSEEAIEAAKADWESGKFGKVPGDEIEFIPLPKD
jgi:hypothetical protein